MADESKNPREEFFDKMLGFLPEQYRWPAAGVLTLLSSTGSNLFEILPDNLHLWILTVAVTILFFRQNKIIQAVKERENERRSDSI